MILPKDRVRVTVRMRMGVTETASRRTTHDRQRDIRQIQTQTCQAARKRQTAGAGKADRMYGPIQTVRQRHLDKMQTNTTDSKVAR